MGWHSFLFIYFLLVQICRRFIFGQFDDGTNRVCRTNTHQNVLFVRNVGIRHYAIKEWIKLLRTEAFSPSAHLFIYSLTDFLGFVCCFFFIFGKEDKWNGRSFWLRIKSLRAQQRNAIRQVYASQSIYHSFRLGRCLSLLYSSSRNSHTIRNKTRSYPCAKANASKNR